MSRPSKGCLGEPCDVASCADLSGVTGLESVSGGAGAEGIGHGCGLCAWEGPGATCPPPSPPWPPWPCLWRASLSRRSARLCMASSIMLIVPAMAGIAPATAGTNIAGSIDAMLSVSSLQPADQRGTFDKKGTTLRDQELEWIDAMSKSIRIKANLFNKSRPTYVHS